MTRTFFEDFTRDNGLPVTVEYSFAGGSPTTYSPRFGADGGDPCEVEIVQAWPATVGHARLATAALRLSFSPAPLGQRLGRILAAPLYGLIRLDEWWRASLTDAERERMEAWLAENHIDEADDEPNWL
jgi:hypothetical protein